MAYLVKSFAVGYIADRINRWLNLIELGWSSLGFEYVRNGDESLTKFFDESPLFHSTDINISFNLSSIETLHYLPFINIL